MVGKYKAKTTRNLVDKMKKLPSVSFCIATFNAERTLERCLKSVVDQDYPKEKVEIIIADGGSKDKTLSIAKRYGARIIDVKKDVQGAEYNKSVAINEAKNDFLAEIDQDNILPHRKWLSKMVNPLLRDKEIIAVEPLRYAYRKDSELLDRYFALFGVNDPLPYYLGKADRLSYHSDKYTLFGESEDKGDYYKVKFSPGKIPTLGANGFLVRRKILMDNAQVGIGKYLHIDVNVDLINKGFDTFAFIKDSIIHETNSKGMITFIKRRKYFMEKYYFQDFSDRRYSVFVFPKDLPGLIYFVFISITVIKPLYDALRGFIKIPDIAWFVHPVMCFGMTAVYSYTTIKGLSKKIYGRILEK